MRGVMRYRPESVVAILDTKRAGETEGGVPIVATVDDALRFNPTRRSSASSPRAAASRRTGAPCSGAARPRASTSRTGSTSG